MGSLESCLWDHTTASSQCGARANCSGQKPGSIPLIASVSGGQAGVVRTVCLQWMRCDQTVSDAVPTGGGMVFRGFHVLPYAGEQRVPWY
jgi:hypothetical protein